MIPQRIETRWEPEELCDFAIKWGISDALARRLQVMAANLPFAIQITSGYRTAEKQRELERQGYRTAPDDISTHRVCPATGADVSPQISDRSRVVLLELGRAARLARLRWGGGSRVDPETGIPASYWHFDLGPRQGA